LTQYQNVAYASLLRAKSLEEKVVKKEKELAFTVVENLLSAVNFFNYHVQQ